MRTIHNFFYLLSIVSTTVIFVPLKSTADVECKDNSRLVPALKVVSDPRCDKASGLAVIGHDKKLFCVESLDGSLKLPGFYRGCVTVTESGLAVTNAEDLTID
ncbi:MAG: hypothetical protein ACXVCY_19575 [Pseudobdellovibrionaceae bacterium]